MTPEEFIKQCTIDAKVISINSLKGLIKEFEKEARDRTKSVTYRNDYKELLKDMRADLRAKQAELNRLRTA